MPQVDRRERATVLESFGKKSKIIAENSTDPFQACNGSIFVRQDR